MDRSKLLEYSAKKLVGKKVKITLQRKQTQFLQGLKFPSYSMIVELNEIKDGAIKYTKQTGMSYCLNLKDEYFNIEKIEEFLNG